MRVNYQLQLDKVLEGSRGKAPLLLLHSCCAPCSSYCLEYLREYFRITVFYYNPNITDSQEYQMRKAEQLRLIQALNSQAESIDSLHNKIQVLDGDYEPEVYLERVKGYEECPEGGERCRICFSLRLEETARQAVSLGFDYFCTTLTISPLKNAQLLNEIGQEIGERYGIPFLPSDFKKRGGYQRSIELSKEYGLYRQDYCGCGFSKAEAAKRRS
ncbi:MAG: epoxyqueuosine reductase QueH [Lachnospiraceae bacterium]|nr:epoxyqueuosine reductase QueH [Lachnospiraceae bacterium]